MNNISNLKEGHLSTQLFQLRDTLMRTSKVDQNLNSEQVTTLASHMYQDRCSLQDVFYTQFQAVPTFMVIDLFNQKPGLELNKKYRRRSFTALRFLKQRIEVMGGRVVLRPNNQLYDASFIPLISGTEDSVYNELAFQAWQTKETENGRFHDSIHENYILEAFRMGFVGDINDYLIGTSIFETYDLKQILSENHRWQNLKLLKPVESDAESSSDLEQTNAVDAEMTASTSRNRKRTRLRVSSSPETIVISSGDDDESPPSFTPKRQRVSFTPPVHNSSHSRRINRDVTPPPRNSDHSRREVVNVTLPPQNSDHMRRVAGIVTPPPQNSDHRRRRRVTESVTPSLQDSAQRQSVDRSVTPAPQNSAQRQREAVSMTPPAQNSDHRRRDARSVTPTPQNSAQRQRVARNVTLSPQNSDHRQRENRSVTPPRQNTDRVQGTAHGSIINPSRSPNVRGGNCDNQSVRKRSLITITEQIKLLKYVIVNNEYERLKGKNLYKEIQAELIIGNRPFESIYNHMKRTLLKRKCFNAVADKMRMGRIERANFEKYLFD